jgi:hypothetical protein
LRVAACLGAWLALPGLRGDLGSFALELGGLSCFKCLIIRCLKRYRLCRLAKFYKNAYISAKSANLKGKKINVGLKPRNKQAACHDTPDTNEARGLKKH